MKMANSDNRLPWIALVLLFLGMGLGCAHQHADVAPAIRGVASYRERIALPPDAQLKVELSEVTLEDALPYQMITRTFPATGSPIAFEIPYDPKQIHPRHKYELTVRILGDGQVLFVNENAVPVFNGFPVQGLQVPLKSARVGAN